LSIKSKAHSAGQAVIELVFSLIVFTIILALISTACVYLYMQHTIITAAREGARAAAINVDIADNFATGETAVKTRVQNFFSQTTGQTLSLTNIIVNPPTGPVGHRNVSVQVNFTIQNPIPIADFLSALGVANTSSISNIPVSANSSMRYEE
jgi:hypothetical protein